MNDNARHGGDDDDIRRPYDIPPTPRTYVSESWKDPGMRRQILKHLAEDYDWYLERMLASMFRNRGWDEDDRNDCLSDVKIHFFAPTDAAMNSGTRGFWLAKWDKTSGPLRWYFLACVRNFITDRWRRRNDRVGGEVAVGDSGTGGEFNPVDGGPTPEQAAVEREFEARFDRKILVDKALQTYRAECERERGNAERWRVYQFYVSAWPQPTMEHLAQTLGLTRFDVNNHIHKSRVRVLEILWLLVRSLETDDTLADQAMLAMVGRLPACRFRRMVPKDIDDGSDA